MNLMRPTWAEINLDAVAHNMREVRRMTSDRAKVMAVIKADGYGHGANHIAQTLLDNGAERFAVATLTEAISLRRKFKSTPILVLGYTPEDLADEVIGYNITQTVFSFSQAKAFNDVAQKQDKIINVHLKLDTGMHRLGFEVSNLGIKDILACYELSSLNIEGVYTHFACADSADKTITHQQVERYNCACNAILKSGYHIPIKHVCNSAGIIDFPEYHFDMVRAGIVLYGLYPSNEVNQSRTNLQQVMQLKTKIAHVKCVKKGSGISYGHTYIAKEDEYIATLPIGYDDGYSRLLSNRADVIVSGQRVPIVGRVCMDQCMVKLSDGSAKCGDTVTLYGGDNQSFITIDEIANLTDTITYEIVCNLNKRVPRCYIKDAKIVEVHDGLLDSGAV